MTAFVVLALAQNRLAFPQDNVLYQSQRVELLSVRTQIKWHSAEHIIWHPCTAAVSPPRGAANGSS